MKVHHFILFCFLACFVHTRTNGQTMVFRGLVADSLTREPLAFVTFSNLSLNKYTQSDQDGLFELPLQAGVNKIKITHVGCDTKWLILERSRSVDTLLLLAHHQHDLELIQISAEKGKLMLMDKDKLDQQTIALEGAKPIGEIMGRLSGVSTLKTGFSIAKPVVQGMFGSRVTVINNGLKQEGQQWGSEHGLEIDPMNLSAISLVKGAESLRYTGDALGGVIVAMPLYPPEKDTQLTTLHVSGTQNGRMGIFHAAHERTVFSEKAGIAGIMVQGTWKRGGNLRTPDYFLPNTGLEEMSGSVAIRLKSAPVQKFDLYLSAFQSEFGILTISHTGNLTDLQRILNPEYTPAKGSFTYAINRPAQNTRHYTARLSWNRNISSSLRLEWIYGYQLNRRKEFDSHNYFNKTAPSLDFKLQTHQSDLFVSKVVNVNLLFQSGISFLFQSNQYEGRFFIPNYLRKDVFQFSLLRYKKRRNEFELGYRAGIIRMDVYKWGKTAIEHFPLEYSGTSWYAGWLNRLNHDWQVSLSAGQVWRNPNISELFSEGLHHGAAAIEYGNINLVPERATTIQSTLKYRHNNTLFETEVYVKQIADYIFLKPKLPAELTIRGAFPAFVYDRTDALFYGVEVFLRQRLTKALTFQEKMHFLQADDLDSKTHLNGIPPFRLDHALGYSLNNLNTLKTLTLNFTITQVLQQTRYTEGTDYLPPPPGYCLFGLDMNLQPRGGSGIKYFVSIDNLTQKRFRNYMNRFRYFADEPGIMISAGVRHQF